MAVVTAFFRKWVRGAQACPAGVSAAALASLPYPVFSADHQGRLKALNASAEGTGRSIVKGDIGAITAMVKRALESGQPEIEVVMVPGEAGALLYELTVLPSAEGAAVILAKDVTLESNLRSALVESRQRYKDLVDISTDFAWEVGSDGRFAFVSGRGALGYAAEQLVGRRPEEFIADEPGVGGPMPFGADQPVADAEVWMRRAAGGLACLRVSASPLLGADGRCLGARGVWQDVTRQRESETALARANNREGLLSYIVHIIRDVVDPADMLTAAAEAVGRALGGCGCRIFRQRGGQFVPVAGFGEVAEDASILAQSGRGDVWDGEAAGWRGLASVSRYRRDVNGAIIVWRKADAAGWGEDERYLLASVADQIGIANEQIANHESILALSRTDALTGLFNRRAFFEELSRRFARLARDGKTAALIYVDLDNFKEVNDHRGHGQGDEALLAVRDILIRHTRPSDLLARLGGDEFALWLEGADDDIAQRRCREILGAAEKLRTFSGHAARPLGMSLGVAVHRPDRPESLSDLVQRADEAMYAVKRDGKGDFRMAAATSQAGRGP